MYLIDIAYRYIQMYNKNYVYIDKFTKMIYNNMKWREQELENDQQLPVSTNPLELCGVWSLEKKN